MHTPPGPTDTATPVQRTAHNFSKGGLSLAPGAPLRGLLWFLGRCPTRASLRWQRRQCCSTALSYPHNVTVRCCSTYFSSSSLSFSHVSLSTSTSSSSSLCCLSASSISHINLSASARSSLSSLLCLAFSYCMRSAAMRFAFTCVTAGSSSYSILSLSLILNSGVFGSVDMSGMHVS